MKAIAVLLAVFLYFSGVQPCVADKQAQSVRAYIPLFFATDRLSKPSKNDQPEFGTQNTDRLDSLTYGILGQEAKLPPTSEADFNGLSAIGWTKINNDASVDTTDPNNTASAVSQDYKSRNFEGWAQFEQALRKAMQDSGKQQVVIYVHGCCVGFKKASEQAVELAAASRVPTVFYDWGSPGGNYVGSLLASPRGQERFNSFMLSMLKAFPTERITVAGLSMGNVLIYNFCLQNPAKDLPRKIDELEIARPDIDSIAFRSNMHRVIEHCSKIHLYVARNDFSINLSGFIRGMAYPRFLVYMLGHPHDKRLLNEKIQVFDVSKLKLGHLLPSGVIAEVINHRGIPLESRKYAYAKDSGGFIAVTRMPATPAKEKLSKLSP